MSIWKSPKNEAIKIADFHLLLFTVIPFAIETAKASIAKPTGIKNTFSTSNFFTAWKDGSRNYGPNIGITFIFEKDYAQTLFYALQKCIQPIAIRAGRILAPLCD
jgi:hypothetical protein